jgi:hypothetical protein
MSLVERCKVYKGVVGGKGSSIAKGVMGGKGARVDKCARIDKG